jgi:hypothetical protein
MTRRTRIRAPLDDDQLFVHAPEDPARMAQGQRVIDLHFDAFIAQVREHRLRDVMEVRVDDETGGDPAALRVAQQSQCGHRHPVIASEEVERVDLALRLLDDVDASLGCVGGIVEDAHYVCVRRGGEEQHAGEEKAPHEHVTRA